MTKPRNLWNFAVVLCTFAVLLGCAYIVWQDTETAPRPATKTKPKPVALAVQRKLNVGTVKPDQMLKDCVMLRNGGIVPLRVQPGLTGCRAPHPVTDRITIAPGGQTGIDVRIDGNAQPGTYTHDFIIHTDDPDNSHVRIVMTYTVAKADAG